ncbi:MAG TPA: carboxymuconolactone decarboxylase family protein [Acidobacteriaceae bacterium]
MTSDSQQGRIRMLERDEVAPEIAAIYDKLLADRGVVPNMFKTIACLPELAMGFAGFLKPLMGNGALQAWYKELIATRMAYLNQCEYCMSSHAYLAKLSGASDAQIEGIKNYEAAPFNEIEKAGFRYADKLHASAHDVNDAVYSAAKVFFDDKQMIELSAVAAAFEFFPRFVNALGIPVTPVPAETK